MGSQKVTVQVIGTQHFFSEEPETEHSRPNGGGGENETDCGSAAQSGPARTRQTVPGLYSCQHGKHFVLYEEDDGEGHKTRSTVKIAEDFFEVIRKGTGSMHVTFRAGGRSESWFDTPYGHLPVMFDVKETEIRLPGPEADRFGVILLARAVYVLEIDGEPVSENTVLVRVKSCKGQTETKKRL